jgi:hypothetical protein
MPSAFSLARQTEAQTNFPQFVSIPQATFLSGRAVTARFPFADAATMIIYLMREATAIEFSRKSYSALDGIGLQGLDVVCWYQNAAWGTDTRRLWALHIMALSASQRESLAQYGLIDRATARHLKQADMPIFAYCRFEAQAKISAVFADRNFYRLPIPRHC